MLDKIKNFFQAKVLEAEENTTSPEQLATAALLVEVMVIDGDLDQHELDSISATLGRMLELTTEQVEELIQ